MSRLVPLCLAAVLVGCAGDAAPGTTASTSPTTSAASTTTTTTVPGEVDVIALPIAGDEMGPGWVEELFLPYGDGESDLGTAPGGDGGSLDLGPEYGAQAPDGSWWILDAAKARLARYSGEGFYLGAVALPAEVLVDGVYFQFQSPRVLADGTLVAFGFRPEGTAMLRVTADGVVDQVPIPGTVLPRVDDGHWLYAPGDAGAVVAVDPVTGVTTEVEWFVTQADTRFRLEIAATGLRVILPDAVPPVDRVLPIIAADGSDSPAHGSIEATTTADGRIHVVMLGASEADETTQLGGYFTILPDGTVTPVIAVRNPFTASDPGSPAHLGAAFGDFEPWFMVVDVDGVRIYRWVSA